MKMSKRFLRRAEIYKTFAEEHHKLDFSKEALEQMYIWESQGKGSIDVKSIFSDYKKLPNGYAVGQKLMNITISAWMNTIDPIGFIYREYKRKPTDHELYHQMWYGWGNLLKELYSEYPHWWLNEIFKNFIKDKDELYGDNYVTNFVESIKKDTQNVYVR